MLCCRESHSPQANIGMSDLERDRPIGRAVPERWMKARVTGILERVLNVGVQSEGDPKDQRPVA